MMSKTIPGQPNKQFLLLMIFLLFSGIINLSPAQINSSGAVSISLEGSSNYHDWDLSSDKGQCNATYTIDSSGNLTTLQKLVFNIKVETLKSGKPSMDKNTYRTFDIDKYPNISFVSSSATIRHQGGNDYIITCEGRLTISSVTQNITLVANTSLTIDKSLKGTGEYHLKMTDYGLTPPSILFGTIKTGNDVTVKFDFLLKS
ncbi:MAG: hypothetical protein GC171_08515 [Terrimonas sp.]|nr:hypothetical protein [Terrimonas sp.]